MWTLLYNTIMKAKFLTFKTVLISLILLALCVCGIFAFTKNKLQLRTARETLDTMRILAAMNEGLPPGQKSSFYELDIFYKSYWAKGYTIDFSSAQTPYYLLAHVHYGLYVNIPHILYMDVSEGKFYCLAYNSSSAAQKFCQKLGGVKVESVPNMPVAEIQKTIFDLPYYTAYYLEEIPLN